MSVTGSNASDESEGDSVFEYLLKKFDEAVVEDSPFGHVYIEDFFDPVHFATIVRAPEVRIPGQICDSDVIEALDDAGYEPIGFPGCTSDVADYLKWRRTGRHSHQMHTATEGFGITFRLVRSGSDFISKVMGFFESEAMKTALCEKFGIERDLVFFDGAFRSISTATRLARIRTVARRQRRSW